ncbi:MAG: GGDEF domain-containing protein [Deferribacterales bacterium]
MIKTSSLPEKWQQKLQFVEHAFQPIINPLSGRLFAVEALIRGTNKAGFESIFDFFDEAYEDGVLLELDMELRRKAVEKYTAIREYSKIKLFYNFDMRITEMCNYKPGMSGIIMHDFRLDPGVFCFEISERHKMNDKGMNCLLNSAKTSGCRIAIDDFGSGFANFELFYFSEPDYIKLDRFLISDIDKDVRKRKFCSHIINLAHFFGISIIAEGVETEKEFIVCRDMGVDLIQGYFISKPMLDTELIQQVYTEIDNLSRNNRRKNMQDSHLISSQMVSIDPIDVNGTMEKLLEKISSKPDMNIIPVVDANLLPLGIISESNLKQYLYKPYGKELLFNKSYTPSIKKFMKKCPSAEITIPLEQILEIFVASPESEGIIITQDLKYKGFMTAQSLLNTLNEKNLAFARDMNPLTKLAGNNLINDYLNKAFRDVDASYVFVYFDFDNFKPFNDRFGFRIGDRAISMFADILRDRIITQGSFIGHIGGDDFFCGVSCTSSEPDCCINVVGKINQIIKDFSDSASAFFDAKEVMAGKYTAKDRSGEIKDFSLLSVSAAIIRLPEGKRDSTSDELSNILAKMKKEAKQSETKTAFIDLGSNMTVDTEINIRLNKAIVQ